MDSKERRGTQVVPGAHGALPVSRPSRTLSLGDPIYLSSAPRLDSSMAGQIGFGPLFVASSVAAGSISTATILCALMFVLGGAATAACWVWSCRTSSPVPLLAGVAITLAVGATLAFRAGMTGFTLPIGIGLGAALLACGLLFVGARQRSR